MLGLSLKFKGRERERECVWVCAWVCVLEWERKREREGESWEKSFLSVITIFHLQQKFISSKHFQRNGSSSTLQHLFFSFQRRYITVRQMIEHWPTSFNKDCTVTEILRGKRSLTFWPKSSNVSLFQSLSFFCLHYSCPLIICRQPLGPFGCH